MFQTKLLNYIDKARFGSKKMFTKKLFVGTVYSRYINVRYFFLTGQYFFKTQIFIEIQKNNTQVFTFHRTQNQLLAAGFYKLPTQVSRAIVLHNSLCREFPKINSCRYFCAEFNSMKYHLAYSKGKRGSFITVVLNRSLRS